MASVLFGGGIVVLLMTTGCFDYFAFLLIPTAHISPLVFGPLGFLLLRSYETRRRRGTLVVLLVATALLCASDRLTFISFVLPACLYRLWRSRSWRPDSLLVAVVSAAGLGLLLFYAETRLLHEIGSVPVLRRTWSFPRFLKMLGNEQTLPVLIAISLATHAGMVVLVRRLDAGAVLYFLTSHVGVVIATILLANRGDVLEHQRYYLVVWLFGLLAFLLFVAQGLWRAAGPRLALWLGWSSVAGACLAALGLAWRAPRAASSPASASTPG